MLKDQANKMMKSEDAKIKQAFFYPNEGITIEADSQEEADKELAVRLSKNK